MKGIITIRNPIGTLFSREVEVPTNHKLYECLRLKRDGRGGPLKVSLRSDFPNELECFLYRRERGKIERPVTFRFSGIKGTKVFKVTGKAWDTGKFVLWTGSFQKTGD